MGASGYLHLGPDGNLWFTEFYGGTIGRSTPAGHITEVAISTTQSNPQGISKGPNGTVWFADQNGKIGWIRVGA